MMKISKAQMKAFSEAAKRRFEKRLVLLLLETRPQVCLRNYDEGLKFVYGEIQRALSYGISSEEALEKYVTASWVLGTPIDQSSKEVSRLLMEHTFAPYYRALRALEYAEMRCGKRDGGVP